jgi:hypothetical protein
MPSAPVKSTSPFDAEILLEQAGLKSGELGEIACAFTYADVETAWRANSAAAPFVRAARHSGNERVQATFTDAVQDFVQKDGAVVLNNKFRWIIGRK